MTPEFPNGTYAYFTCITSNGAVVYPYNIGRQYYGVVTAMGPNASGTVASISESVTTNFVGGPSAELCLSTPVITNNVVTLTWGATEGGTYRVEASANLISWTTNASGVAANLNRGTNTATATTNSFFRVTRTGLASYDSTGF